MDARLSNLPTQARQSSVLRDPLSRRVTDRSRWSRECRSGQCGDCGIRGPATNMRAITHPSLPNYLALTSGSTQAVTDNAGPAAHPLTGPGIFGQLGTGRWRALNESMVGNCRQRSSGKYVVHHNPAVYYRSIASQCAAQDVPLTDQPDLSAPFTFITPDNRSNTHDTSVAFGDRWLSSFIPKITSSAEYRTGRTLVVITYDEDEGTASNRIATILLAPSVKPGLKDATSMRPGFGL